MKNFSAVVVEVPQLATLQSQRNQEVEKQKAKKRSKNGNETHKKHSYAATQHAKQKKEASRE